jgi:hypothetical protein
MNFYILERRGWDIPVLPNFIHWTADRVLSNRDVGVIKEKYQISTRQLKLLVRRYASTDWPSFSLSDMMTKLVVLLSDEKNKTVTSMLSKSLVDILTNGFDIRTECFTSPLQITNEGTSFHSIEGGLRCWGEEINTLLKKSFSTNIYIDLLTLKPFILSTFALIVKKL